MILLVKIIGIIWVALGVIFFLKPEIIRSVIRFMKIDKRIYIGGAARIIIGILLLVATKAVSVPWITGVIGAIVLLSGILLLLLGMQRVHAIMDKMHALPDTKLRIPPALIVALGILLILSA